MEPGYGSPEFPTVNGKQKMDQKVSRGSQFPLGLVQYPVVPKVGTAATEDVLVGIELKAIDFDDHITELAL
jgi:hypothetical protein